MTPHHRLTYHEASGETYCDLGDECPICGIEVDLDNLEVCPDCGKLVDPATAEGHDPLCIAFPEEVSR